MRRLPETRPFRDLKIRRETSSTLLLLFHAVKSDELVDIPGPSIDGLSMAGSLEAYPKFQSYGSESKGAAQECCNMSALNLIVILWRW